MDTIVTPVTVITLDSTKITHNIKVDLVARYFPPVVRLVQYDQSLPVIAVSLMQNGQPYTLPVGAAANIRVHKPDATYVYNPALGCDSTRKIVYFEVTQAMAAANGDGLAIIEIVVDGDIAGTSLITLHFEENPVPEDAIESSDEWETIYELGERIIASTVTPVSTAAGMTDHNVVYLYTGTESGWNQGHMYYYNGTTWVDAGIAVTDTTLSVAGLAADAKKTGDEIADLKDGLQQVEESVIDTYVTDTASGAIASFPDGADNVPVKSLNVNVEPVQSGSGDPSPDNVRPISGHTQTVVTMTGKNLLKVTATTQTTNGITFTVNSDGTITADGTAEQNAFLVLTNNDIEKAMLGQTIILNGCPSGGGTSTYRIQWWNPDGTEASVMDVGNGTRPFTPSTINGNISIFVTAGATLDHVVFQPMIRVASDADSTFAPYNGQTVTIDLNGTRYGGTLDVGTGVLTVDRLLITYNGSEAWRVANGGMRAEITLPSGAKVNTANNTVVDGCLTNQFKQVTPDQTWNGGSSNIGFSITTYREIAVCQTGTRTMTVDSWKSYLQSNPLQVVYKLATPQTVQLTANEISTFLGQNNIWADCGNTEVEYRADTKLYINKMLNA